MRYLFFILCALVSATAIAQDKNIIEPKDVCYNECKPRKKILGIFGSTEEGLDRSACVSCLEKNPDKYKLDKSVMLAGSACYNDCKPSGFGSNKKSGTERSSCVSCLVDHPELYTLSGDIKIKSIKCDLSYDEMTVSCENGHNYKRDSSAISDIERNLIKDMNEKNIDKDVTKPRVTPQ